MNAEANLGIAGLGISCRAQHPKFMMENYALIHTGLYRFIPIHTGLYLVDEEKGLGCLMELDLVAPGLVPTARATRNPE